MTKKDFKTLALLRAQKSDALIESDALIKEYYLRGTPPQRKSTITKRLNALEKKLLSIHSAINSILGGMR
jgi:hypothetical protein